jgi:hypothetical protein
MKLTIASLGLLSCMVGCADAVSVPIIAPTGEHWIGVDCSGHSQVACYAEAGTQCPSGYDIADNEGHFTTEAKAVATSEVEVASVHESHYGHMIIKCHGKSKAELDAAVLPQISACGAHSHPVTSANGYSACEWDSGYDPQMDPNNCAAPTWKQNGIVHFKPKCM